MLVKNSRLGCEWLTRNLLNGLRNRLNWHDSVFDFLYLFAFESKVNKIFVVALKVCRKNLEKKLQRDQFLAIECEERKV